MIPGGIISYDFYTSDLFWHTGIYVCIAPRHLSSLVVAFDRFRIAYIICNAFYISIINKDISKSHS